MYGRVLAALGAILCVPATPLPAQQQFQVYATIVDASGGPASIVQPADIRLMENGVEAKVLKVEASSLPVKVQLLVDNGAGLGAENFVHLRNGVNGLVDALPDGVELTLVATAPQPRFLVRPTSDRAAIAKGMALLSPDRSVGRFVESLYEATERIEGDKSDHVDVIVSFATTAGDTIVRDRDVERVTQRLQLRPTTVHVVLLSLLGASSASGGRNQTDIGIGVTAMTGGRFESIAAPNRLATLLPEIGSQIAKAHEGQTRQFKITAERPSGASGELSQVSLGARGGYTVTSLSFDGRAGR
jgi:hypothetical protein